MVGHELKSLRVGHLRLTQRELARRCGVSRRTVQRHEATKDEIPALFTLAVESMAVGAPKEDTEL
jgi:DNA-binding XRE family transcriptional regulator